MDRFHIKLLNEVLSNFKSLDGVKSLEIKLYWPNCNYHNKKWGQKKIDSFWVECSFEEAKREVFPYLTTEEKEQTMENWRPKEEGLQGNPKRRDCLCYLISKDLKSVSSFPWYYPYSGHWNAYCPFQEMKKIEIKELTEISNINIEV
jgi:hypothetical protein